MVLATAQLYHLKFADAVFSGPGFDKPFQPVLDHRDLVATSKHFALYYMMASWVLAGGVLVVAVIEVQRLLPRLSSRAISSVAALCCAFLIVTTLLDVRHDVFVEMAADRTGAKLSQIIVSTAPACANVSRMFVRAPENEMYHGGDMALGLPELANRFSEAYVHTHAAALLDDKVYGPNVLYKNFHPYSYAKLATECPCIVIRSARPLTGPHELFDLKPDHCIIDGIHVYTVGLACKVLQSAAS